jgi:hypothetical protein
VLVPLLATAAYSWKARVARLFVRLRQRPAGPCASFDETELDALPAPVARYFRAALQNGQPIVRHALLTQRGEILVREKPALWRPFTATEAMTVGGFVWDARVRVVPGFPIRVCDFFIAGVGSMRASILGVWPLLRVQGTPEIAAGALLRYLAEAVWMPTALLPSQGVRWTPIDETSARATITVGETTESLDFHFGDDGLVQRVFTNARPRDGHASAPWQGRFADYRDVHGMKIPLSAEAEWLLRDGPLPSWRGHIVSAAFESEAKAG